MEEAKHGGESQGESDAERFLTPVVRDGPSPSVGSDNKSTKIRTRRNTIPDANTVESLYADLGQEWNSLGSLCVEDFGKEGRCLLWGVPLWIVACVCVFGWTQTVTIGSTRLEIIDNQENLINSQVKEYSTIANVRMTFEAGATALGMLVGWASLVWPHLAFGLLLIFWLCPMPSIVRGRFLFVLSQAAKACWAGSVNGGVSVITFFITIKFNVHLLKEVLTLQLYQTSSKLDYLQIALQIVMCGTAQWMLLMHRTAVTAEAMQEVTRRNSAENTIRNNSTDIGNEQKDGWTEEGPSPQGGDEVGVFDDNSPKDHAASGTFCGGSPLGMYTLWPDAHESWQWGIYLGFLTFSVFIMIAVWLASTTVFAKLVITGLASDLEENDAKEIELITFPYKSTRKLGDQAQINFSQGLDFWLFVISPTAAGVSAILLWGLPLQKIWQRRLLTVVEFFSGWSCLELFFITTSISLYSQKIVCDALLKSIQACQTLAKTGTVCFSVEGQFSKDSWWILLVALVHRIMLFCVMARAHSCLHVQEFEEVLIDVSRIEGNLSGNRTPFQSANRISALKGSPVPQIDFDDDAKVEA